MSLRRQRPDAATRVVAVQGIDRRGSMMQAIVKPGTSASTPRILLTAAAVWTPQAGLYRLFARSAGTTKALAGAACASLGTIWPRRAGQVGEPPFRYTVPILRQMADALAALPGQTLQFGFGLMRAIGGGTAAGSIGDRPISTIARHPLSDAGAEARAERAVGVLAASLCPRSYVLRSDPACIDVVVHVSRFGCDSPSAPRNRSRCAVWNRPIAA